MLSRALSVLDALVAAVGRLAAALVLAMIAVMVFEMVSRGLFGVSQSWASDVTAWLLVGIIFLGGPWALASGRFVRVDALYGRFPPRARALVDTLVSTVLFALFAGILIRLGGDLAVRSFMMGERPASGGWDGPVWLAKALVPFGTVLLSLAWVGHLARTWQAASARGDGGERA